jgi:hypothetical protein
VIGTAVRRRNRLGKRPIPSSNVCDTVAAIPKVERQVRKTRKERILIATADRSLLADQLLQYVEQPQWVWTVN